MTPDIAKIIYPEIRIVQIRKYTLTIFVRLGHDNNYFH